MKTSLEREKPDALSPQTARGCGATNLALPGFGSLMAGRVAGYPQAALTVVGFALTLGFGVRFTIWVVQNWVAIYDPEGNPAETMLNIWLAARWSLLGMALFGVSWLWALATSAAILRAARKAATKDLPPVLN